MNNINKSTKIDRYSYVICACAFITYFVADYAGYQIPPLSHLVMPALDIDNINFSRLFSAYMLPGALFCLVAGLLCDKYGTKKCIGVSIIISSIAAVLRVFASTFISFFFCMMLIGVMLFFISTNVTKIIAHWVPPNKISVFVGITIAGGPLGMTVAMSTSAFFETLRPALVTSAAFCVVVVFLWFIFMKDKPKESEHTYHYIDNAPQTPLVEGLKVVLRNKSMWVIGICLGFVLAPAVCMTTFMPRALQLEHGMDAVTAGAMTSIIMLGNIVGSICGPIICMLIGRMKPYIFCSSIIGALGVAFSWILPNKALIGAGLFIAGFVIAALLAQLLSMPVLFKEIGPALGGTAVGFISTIRSSFAVVIPSYIIAPITGDNYFLLFLIAGGLLILCALLSLKLPKIKY